MPSGGIRVDENTLGFAKEADDFLSLASAGLSSRDIPVFWRELSCDPERVQSFVVCLMVKLIALDGGQGKLNLSRNYCEICGLDVDVQCLKTWMSKEKPFDQERKHLSLLLQHQIICTLYFLKQFYPHTPSNHLKNIHIRWNLARNCVRSENAERCDPFEVMVMKDYYRYGTEVPKVINPVDPQLLVEIFEACCKHHRRGQLGYLPSRHSKLCNYREVAESLAYYRLYFIASGSQSSVCDVINELVSVLKRCSIDTADHGEKEILLPVLQLLRQFTTEAVHYNTADVYRAVQPFYLWPTPHCDVAKSLLDIIQREDVRGGSAFREKLIAEQHSELGLNTAIGSNMTLNQQYYHHMLVDVHASRSYTFSQAFEKQEPKDPISLKKLLLRNVFYSLLSGVDLVKLDEQLEGMANQLDRLCTRALTILFSPEEDNNNGSIGITGTENITVELNQLYSEIMSHVSDEPVPEHLHLTPQQLEDFSLPELYFHVHSVTKATSSAIKEKLKDIITNLSGKVRRHKKLSGRRTNTSSVSQDSGTGSTVDHEFIPPPDDATPLKLPVRPLSAPASRIHSVSEADDICDHSEAISVPTSPLQNCRPPTSPAVSFNSSQPNLSDDPSTSDVSDSASVNSSTSTSRSRSQSPTSSENGFSYFSSLPSSYAHRSSVPGYGIGNRVRTESIGRRMTSPYIDSVTRQGTLVRMQSKNGMNTIRVRRKSLAPIATVSKVLKIVIAGDDRMINNVACAYAELKIHEPNLFTGLQIQFFYVPLSEVSTATEASLNGTTHNRKSSESADHLIQPLIDGAQPSLYGEDVWLGCFLGNMDSWYERNVLLATHNLLRIIPSPEKTSHLAPPPNILPIGLPKVSEKLSPSPAQLLRSLVTTYCREARNVIRFNMYSVELEVKSDKPGRHKGTHHQEQQEYRGDKCHYMLQRVDMQRCVKGNKQVKAFEAKLTIEEVTLDCTRLKERTFSVKNTWSVGVASVPRVYDLHVNNPEHDNLELTVTQAAPEGRMTSAYKLSDENSYHVKSVELETKEKPISVMINGDPSAIIDNVTRVMIRPAMAGETNNLINSLSLDEQQSQKQVYFPLMSFWPVDL